MAPELVAALAQVKRAAAAVNRSLGKLPRTRPTPSSRRRRSAGAPPPGEFPLAVWQTGSGTQSNMNMNEVLANRGSELMGGERGEARLLHPNDHVNMGQSSNDMFPTAMHVAAALAVAKDLLPALARCAARCRRSARLRRHRQDRPHPPAGRHAADAGPGIFRLRRPARIRRAGDRASLPGLLLLAAGGTAVGTGLNAHPEFARASPPNSVRAPACLQERAEQVHGAGRARRAGVGARRLKTLATALMKIANDVRWMASGPRSGLGEITIPENEPGSSIMPGKVNPTQCEALTMLCCQVFGNDVALTIGGSQGNFELNVFKPMIAHNFLQSARLLADGMRSFDEHCARGIEPNRSASAS
jgi:fumarate hydratase class II